MKLRNKKTGQLGNFIINKDHFECVDLDYVPEYRNLAELNEDWEDAPEEPKEYWYMDSLGRITQDSIDDSWVDKRREQIGNYFETEEEAEKAVEKLKAFKRLKDKGFRFRGWIREHKKGSADITIASFIDDDFDITDDINLLFGGGE